MTKISFCGISGSGMSALAQIRLHQGYEVRGSDRSFDQGKDQSNKQALEKLGIKIYPQDGSAITDDHCYRNDRLYSRPSRTKALYD